MLPYDIHRFPHRHKITCKYSEAWTKCPERDPARSPVARNGMRWDWRIYKCIHAKDVSELDMAEIVRSDFIQGIFERKNKFVTEDRNTV